MSPRWERLLVVLVALHSVGVGAGLLFLTEWGLALGGWHDVRPLFFPRQAGVFHFVVAAGYLIEHFRYDGVWLLVTTKSVAVVFLAGMTVLGGVPPLVPLSAVVDGAMGVAVLVVHLRARRERPA